MKGIVLCKEYTIKDEKVIETDKPSIIKKYVKQNIVNLGVKYDFRGIGLNNWLSIDFRIQWNKNALDELYF
ncbi:MAG TPA: hypothetical protein VFI73_03405 [Candidatus Nitrosopolaris sp.]|nr:hypothetical protein [Candidatus Nitrosopolaris sp.]